MYRLSTANLQHIAEMLGLPTCTKASAEVEGKLADSDREPQNVQVVLHEVKSTTATMLQLSLMDESGVFEKAETVFYRATVAELAGKVQELEDAKEALTKRAGSAAATGAKSGRSSCKRRRSRLINQLRRQPHVHSTEDVRELSSHEQEPLQVELKRERQKALHGSWFVSVERRTRS